MVSKEKKVLELQIWNNFKVWFFDNHTFLLKDIWAKNTAKIFAEIEKCQKMGQLLNFMSCSENTTLFTSSYQLGLFVLITLINVSFGIQEFQLRHLNLQEYNLFPTRVSKHLPTLHIMLIILQEKEKKSFVFLYNCEH